MGNTTYSMNKYILIAIIDIDIHENMLNSKTKFYIT